MAVVVLDQIGVLLVKSFGIFSYQPQEGEEADLRHQEHVQHTIVRHGVADRHKAPAVMAAVADAHDSCLPLLPVYRSHLHRHRTADTFKQNMFQ